MPERDEEQQRTPETPDRSPLRDRLTGRSAAANRMHDQASWVDQQIRVAMARGEFDHLPGAGKPIRDLGTSHDPDWWLKKLVEREQIALLPPSVQLRKEDAELDATLDGLATERQVRERVEDFNERVIAARYRPPEGPPLITMPRDVEETVAAWRTRRQERLDRLRAERAAADRPQRRPRRRWFGRRR